MYASCCSIRFHQSKCCTLYCIFAYVSSFLCIYIVRRSKTCCQIPLFFTHVPCQCYSENGNMELSLLMGGGVLFAICLPLA